MRAAWICNVWTTTTRRRWRHRDCGVKTAAWRTFAPHATKSREERVTVQGPVKAPAQDIMSQEGAVGGWVCNNAYSPPSGVGLSLTLLSHIPVPK